MNKTGQSNRLVVLGNCPPIKLFDDNDGVDLPSRYEKIRNMCVAKDLEGDGARWQAFADELLLEFLNDDQRVADCSGLPLLECVAALASNEANYLSNGPWVALQLILKKGMNGPARLRYLADFYDLIMYFSEQKSGNRPINRYLTSKEPSEQWFYNARGALSVAGLVGSLEINSLLNLSVRMGWENVDTTDLASAIESGKVIVYQPRSSGTHGFVGKCLKTLFFRLVMERRDMLRPIGYICDEFQRYITADDESGDHTFLDRCRAFRVNAIMATQSIAALQAVINPKTQSSSVLDSILVNCTSKAVFRTPDVMTVTTMKAFFPPNPTEGTHILTARPPASLTTGEYYYVVREKFGRTKYRLSVFDDQVQMKNS